MRASMAHLVAKLKALLPTEALSLLTDADLCECLDANSTLAQAVSAHAVANPWDTTFTTYAAERGYWERSPTVHNGAAPLTVTDFDLLTGEFTLAEPSSLTPLYVAGRTVDIWGAAAQALEICAARLSAQFDFASDDQRFQRSQQAGLLLEAARAMRARMQPTVAALVRRQ